MNNPTAAASVAELNELKQELTAVREQLNNLRAQVNKMAHFFIVQAPDPDNGLPEIVMIRCTNLTIFHSRDQKHEDQMRLGGTDDGPFLALDGKDGNPRLELSVDDDGSQLELFSKDRAIAVQIRADEASNRGFVGVFDAGKPRAGLKAGNHGGIVTVTHDDGRPRGFLASGTKTGELHLLNAETQEPTIVLHSTPEGGGFINVNDSSGIRQAIVSTTPLGGHLLLNNDLGIQRVHLCSAQDSAVLMLDWGGTDSVLLAALETGGNLVLKDANGKQVAELPNSGKEAP